jgi:hypothetical protein
MNIFDEIDQHFLSGNDVPVTSIMLTREMWEKVKQFHNVLCEVEVEENEYYPDVIIYGEL